MLIISQRTEDAIYSLIESHPLDADLVSAVTALLSNFDDVETIPAPPPVQEEGAA